MKLTIVTGSRADMGPLEWVIKTLEADSYFKGQVLNIWGLKFDLAFATAVQSFEADRPDMVLVCGDRYEVLGASTAAHLLRVPIAHLAGGDVTEGSYDDAMRDCITRMASLHFTTSVQSEARVQFLMGQKNVHMVGSPGVDFLMFADWKKERPIEEPYVVVAYYPQTIDGQVDWDELIEAINGRLAVFMRPNLDRGSDVLNKLIDEYRGEKKVIDSLPHREFLNLVYHCEEFIGNSSAIYYEAPFLGIKTREIGKRQRGRVIPFGDGKASERIRDILKAWHV